MRGYNFFKVPENLRRYANRAPHKWSYYRKAWFENREVTKSIHERHVNGKIAKGFPTRGIGCYGTRYETEFGPDERDEEVLDKLERLKDEYRASKRKGRPMKAPAPGVPAWTQEDK